MQLQCTTAHMLILADHKDPTYRLNSCCVNANTPYWAISGTTLGTGYERWHHGGQPEMTKCSHSIRTLCAVRPPPAKQLPG
jgi:hypothetical protein